MEETDYFAHEGEGMALSFAMITLASASTVLRFVARKRSKAGLELNDWMILPALLGLYGFAITMIWESSKGAFGWGPQVLPIPLLQVLGKAYYVGPIFSIPAISFAKISILCLYHRVFASHTFRRWLLLVGLTVVLWFIGCFLAVVLHCIPPKTLWDPRIPGTCIDFTLFVQIIEPINCLQELVIAFMPIGVIRRLQLNLSQKLALSFIFSLGIFVAVISIIRIAFVCDPNAPPDIIHTSNKWLLGQLGVAIACANALTYRPLIPKGVFVPSRISDWYKALTSRASASRYSKKGYVNSEEGANGQSSRYGQFNDAENGSKRLAKVSADAYDRFGDRDISLQTVIEIRSSGGEV